MNREHAVPLENRGRKWTGFLAALLCLLILSVTCWAEDEVLLKSGETRLLTVKPVTRVAVGNAGIVDVKVVSPTEILLIAKAEGKTSLILWPAEGGPVERPVRVNRPDPPCTEAELKAMIADEGVVVRQLGGYLVLDGEPRQEGTRQRLTRVSAAFPEHVLNLVPEVIRQEPAVTPSVVQPPLPESPGDQISGDATPNSVDEIFAVLSRIVPSASLDICEVNGRVLITGNVTTEEERGLVRQVADLFDPTAAVFVGLVNTKPPQIEIRSRMVEIQRSALRELGVMWPEQVLLGDPIRPAFGRVVDPEFDKVVAKLAAYESSGRARILAEPTLVVTSGMDGEFLAGGEVPVPVAQESGVTVEWKEYGVRLKVRPSVQQDGLINLSIRPEVSSLDWANAAKVGDSSLPALRMRMAETSVIQASGATLVIGGLAQSSESSYGSQVPGLSQIPLLGRLFRLPRTETEDTELAIFVSAVILDETAAAVSPAESTPQIRGGHTPI